MSTTIFSLWMELSRPRVTIDAYRQQLQQAYLDQFNGTLNPPKPGPSPGPPLRDAAAITGDGLSAQERALMRGELLVLRTDIQTALPRAADRTTRLHLQTMVYEIG